MKAYWRVEVQLNTFFELSLDGGEWSASCLSCFTHRERAPGTNWIRAEWAPEPAWTQW